MLFCLRSGEAKEGGKTPHGPCATAGLAACTAFQHDARANCRTGACLLFQDVILVTWTTVMYVVLSIGTQPMTQEELEKLNRSAVKSMNCCEH